MFFTPRLDHEMRGGEIYFAPETEIKLWDCNVSEYLADTAAKKLFVTENRKGTLCKRLTFMLGFTDEIKAKIVKRCKISGNDEEYAVLVGEETFICAKNEIGLVFGLSTLLQLKTSGELSCRLIYDYPSCPVRGYRVYMPGRKNIGIFKEMIDLLAYYKYNSIILEIGGAMEYKKHPKIAEKWQEFCRDVHRYSGRAKEIQHGTYQWEKNSIHCDNGEGDVLTHEECADIAAYCRARGLEVIPECPTFSHSDYIVQAYPELRERHNDYHADTYCPLHPDVYKVVFDIFDEVIEVFKPKRINIGHDELYSVGVCDRCKGKDPVDLYINDITVLRDYLASKGVGTLMWGEKLLKAVGKNGKKYGGWYDPRERNGAISIVPSLYPCAERMPSGVTFLHWYWSFDHNLDRVYHDHGYDMVFGNFNAIDAEHYRERIDWGCRGGFVSNWGSNEDEYMQRNLQYRALIGTAYAFWNDDYDYDRREELVERTMQEGYRLHCSKLRADSIIKIEHTTDHYEKFKFFYDGIFIEDSVYLLGNYELTYSDGTTAYLPVRYGTHLTTCNIDDPVSNQSYSEMIGGTRPKKYGDIYYYECAYENPDPEKQIVGIRYIPVEDKKDVKVYVKKITLPEAKIGTSNENEETEKAHIFQ